MIGLLIISLTTGLSYILIGFWIVKKPTSISGYNKSDEHHRKTYPFFVQKLMTLTGIVTIIGCLICILLKWHIGVFIFLLLPSFIMIFILLLKEKKTYNKKSTIVMIVFFAVLTIILSIFLVNSSREHSIFFEQEGIRISGLYGGYILFKDIAEVTLTNKIPTIQLRTNGFALGAVRRGYFRLKEMGTVKLFLTSTSGPYVQIRTVSNQYIIINFGNTDKTIDSYNKIKSYL
jgi:hypothetical protein